MRRAVAILGVLAAIGCSRGTGAAHPGPDGGSASDGGAAGRDGGSISGAENGGQIYARLCLSCHGALAEGIAPNPALNRFTRGKDAMVAAIAARMPPTSPGSCAGACASDVADYILGTLQVGTSTEAPCTAAARWPRQLRLLTAREYKATIRDLFNAPTSPRSCSDDNGCQIATESCVASQCATDPCTRHTFLYSGSASSVVVAGSFNNWASTVAAGAWPLQQQGGRWVLKHDVPAGTHQYKLVIDGSTWIADPNNPSSSPDGFGGQNSVLDTSRCGGASGGGGLSLDLDAAVSGFPPENRPRGFSFDDDATSRVMSSSRMNAELSAAKSIAHQAATQSARWLSCDRARAEDCARAFVSGFATRAYRRPLTAGEASRLTALITGGAAQGLDHGLELGIRAVLASPSFLYRSEVGVLGSDGVARLDGYEVAALLSYFFWASFPDGALLDAAARGALADPMERQAQARRLLADPRSKEGLSAFALGWLGVERILTADKRADLFPELDAALRQDMLSETTTFFASVVREGSGKYGEILTADYSFLDDRLARLYGLSGAPSGSLAKISYGASGRSGILSHASVLGAYAYSDSSAPVRRGVFVREHLLCQGLPTPPPNAGALPAVDPNATTRERFRQHSDSPSCRGCHALIDPVGFGFERFDAIGRARETENGHPIDTSGDLTDSERLGAGTHQTFDGTAGLGAALAVSPNANACFARQMWRYAKGGLESELDRCGARAVEQAFRDSGGDIRELMVAIAGSQAFVERAP